jgi:Leucine-rich repeat (LRR) protein
MLPIDKIPQPPSARFIQLNIQGLVKVIEDSKKAGSHSKLTDLAKYQTELRKYRDFYRLLRSATYEIPSDLNTTEKEILSKIFLSMGGYSWAYKFGWVGLPKTMLKPEIKPLEAEAELFDGVKVSSVDMFALRQLAKRGGEGASTLLSLDLEGNGCEGSLVKGISKFSNCERLNLSLNAITGPYLKEIGLLADLRLLDLSGNDLEGSLTSECFEGLHNLEKFDLSFNMLHGNIPDSFEALTHLLELNLSGNAFTGTIPESISNLTSLKSLKLYANALEGPIPQTFSNLTSLTDINISENKLTHGIDVLFAIPSLQLINLSLNLIEQSFSEIYFRDDLSIETIYLQDNLIFGSINDSFCQLKRLRKLNLSNNKITGTLPFDFGSLEKLEVCVLSDNEIVGPVPRSIARLRNLKDFHIFSQWLSEDMFLPRAFNAHSLYRLVDVGPRLNLNSYCWNPDELYGDI